MKALKIKQKDYEQAVFEALVSAHRCVRQLNDIGLSQTDPYDDVSYQQAYAQSVKTLIKAFIESNKAVDKYEQKLRDEYPSRSVYLCVDHDRIIASAILLIGCERLDKGCVQIVDTPAAMAISLMSAAVCALRAMQEVDYISAAGFVSNTASFLNGVGDGYQKLFQLDE